MNKAKEAPKAEPKDAVYEKLLQKVSDLRGCLLAAIKKAKISKKDFPKTKEGKILYCDYQVILWHARKEDIATDTRMIDRLKARHEKAKAKALEIEKQINEAK